VLVLTRVPAHLQRVLTLTGVDTVLRMYDTVTAAQTGPAVSKGCEHVGPERRLDGLSRHHHAARGTGGYTLSW
jgi:hypothetical protein